MTTISEKLSQDAKTLRSDAHVNTVWAVGLYAGSAITASVAVYASLKGAETEAGLATAIGIFEYTIGNILVRKSSDFVHQAAIIETELNREQL